jgi:hypothetical protein
MTETKLSRAVQDALALDPDVLAIRVNSGKVRVRGGWMQLADEGTADLMGGVAFGSMPITCRLWALEIKKPGARTDRARAAKQAAFRERVRALGGFAAQVDSVGAAVEAMKRAKRGDSE